MFLKEFSNNLSVTEQEGKAESNLVGKLNSMALVRKQIIPTVQLPLVSEVSANFCG
jgi:hypothetical protein